MLSVKNLSKSEILEIFQRAKHFETSENHHTILKNKTMITMFYEPSTRTQVSFQKAMLELGGNVISLNASDSSVKKGESLQDTINTLECFGDVIVLRTSENLNDIKSKVPIVNAGDGSNEHPTQALLDLYTIWKNFGHFNIVVTFFGDLKYSRTVHSLVPLLKLFGASLYFVGTPELMVENEVATKWENIAHCDVIYVTRPQVERWPSDLSRDFQYYQLPTTNNTLVLHPLPRGKELKEIPDSVWQQVQNGLYIRMAILERYLKKTSRF